ncbi:MAG: tripartite tricarboxylate transporter TctB family protein [Rhodobacteraceae bacterium]|nr:tripartite tricarboxylate transporter TctB family protein [Paracoccaceae bacterium]
MRATDLFFSAFYIILLAVAGTQLSQLSDINSAEISSKLYPTLVVSIGLIMGVLETVRVLFARGGESLPKLSEVWAPAFNRRRMTLLFLFVVYLIAIKPVGFLVSTGMFCFGTIFILSPQRNLRVAAISIAVSAGILSLIYLLLVVYLEAFLP